VCTQLTDLCVKGLLAIGWSLWALARAPATPCSLSLLRVCDLNDQSELRKPKIVINYYGDSTYAPIRHYRKQGSRDHVTSSLDAIGRLDEMFVAPTNRSVFHSGRGVIHKMRRCRAPWQRARVCRANALLTFTTSAAAVVLLPGTLY